MDKVVILQRFRSEYRTPFYKLLHEKLRNDGIELQVVYGVEQSSGLREPEWVITRVNKVFNVGPIRLVWQPCLREIATADLVIIEQANSLLILYYLIVRKWIYKRKFAFWGHGTNRQAAANSLLNRFKRCYTNSPSHWFAYTDGVKDLLLKNGYLGKRITAVRNSNDTERMRVEYCSLTDSDASLLKIKYGIQPGETVFVYCGMYYREKRIDFLIEAVDRLVGAGHRLKLILVGDTSQNDFIAEAIKTRPWIILTGARYGIEKAKLFRIADIFLLPGAIGLAVLDSFVYETPIVTTDFSCHGPEFEYLKPGINGIVSKNSLEDFVQEVSNLIADKSMLESLRVGCREERLNYSIKIMAENFHKGVLNTLASST